MANSFRSYRITEPVQAFVEQYMSKHAASHDVNHILLVSNLSQRILASESAKFPEKKYDELTVALSAILLHDVEDHKYLKSGEVPAQAVRHVLLEHGASEDLATKVQRITDSVSWSKEVKDPKATKEAIEKYPELAIVQDADRLDVIGAVGIARLFTYQAVKTGKPFAEVMEHFDEKLFKVEGMMKTEIGKQLAAERTRRLRKFKTRWQDETSG